jgi:hypothetical protein
LEPAGKVLRAASSSSRLIWEMIMIRIHAHFSLFLTLGYFVNVLHCTARANGQEHHGGHLSAPAVISYADRRSALQRRLAAAITDA